MQVSSRAEAAVRQITPSGISRPPTRDTPRGAQQLNVTVQGNESGWVEVDGF